MKTLWIALPKEWVCLGAVPLLWLPNLEELASKVQGLLSQYDFAALVDEDKTLILTLLQRIADLHPRIDKPGCFGFPVDGLEVGEVQKLFGAGGEVYALNQVDPSLIESAAEKDYYPPFSSGDVVSDWLADLTCSFQGDFSEALALVSSRDVSSVMAISRRLGDLWMGAKKREERGLKAWYREWEKENEDLLTEEALFGDL